MDWAKLHEATSQAEKPVPGWLFREICRDAAQSSQEIPDIAEYLMRCVSCDSEGVRLKGCLVTRHLADEVDAFRQYLASCPEALALLKDVSAPPPLAITASIERPETKVLREAAARALRSCTSNSAQEAEKKAHVQGRIQGFGNYIPPEEEQPRQGVHGAVDQLAGYVGDAVADTVDDIREKGAIGAVRDGVLDAADLLVGGVGAVWSLLAGRSARGKKGSLLAGRTPSLRCRRIGYADHAARRRSTQSGPRLPQRWAPLQSLAALQLWAALQSLAQTFKAPLCHRRLLRWMRPPQRRFRVPSVAALSALGIPSRQQCSSRRSPLSRRSPWPAGPARPRRRLSQRLPWRRCRPRSRRTCYGLTMT